MRKTTLIKLLCLALACAMLLPMVIACGNDTPPVTQSSVDEKVEITFSANRGTIVDGNSEVKINKGSKLSESKMPLVEREGYEFLYWSYDRTGNTEWDPVEKFNEDTTLYAVWQEVGSGNNGGNNNGGNGEGGEDNTDKEMVTVKFNTGVGYFEDNKYTYSVEKNGFFTGALPTPVSDNPAHKFEGWFKDAAFTVVASRSDQYSADTELYAYWSTLTQCTDGSYDHTWSGWEETVAPTCTKAGTNSQFCTTCNAENKMTGSPATGHDYRPWEEGFLRRERTCKIPGCGYEQYQEFENITLSTLGKTPASQMSLQMSSGWGSTRVTCLVDGSWDQPDGAVFCGNGCEVKVTINLLTASPMDRIYVKGRGQGAGFNIYVQYEGDSDYTLAGAGSFLSDAQNADKDNRVIPFAPVDNTRNVVSVQIVMTTCSQGQDYWEEVAFIKIPPIEAE